MDSIKIRIHAAHIRTRLAKGYPTVTATKPGSFLYILARIPDATLCEMDKQHASENAEHQAMMSMYRSRVAAEKQDEKSIRNSIAASVQLV